MEIHKVEDGYIQGRQGRNAFHVEIFIVIDCIEIFVALFLKTKSVRTLAARFLTLSFSLFRIPFLFYRVTIFLYFSLLHTLLLLFYKPTRK